MLETVIFSPQMGFTGDFVADCPFKLFLAVRTVTPLFSLTVTNFVVFFQVIG